MGKRGNEAWASPLRRRLVQRERNTVMELTGSREPRDSSLQRVGKKGKEQGGLAVFPAWELGLEMQRGKSGKLFLKECRLPQEDAGSHLLHRFRNRRKISLM